MDQPAHANVIAPDTAATPGPRRIGLLLFDGVEELDAVGPWEVLANWTQEHPEDGWSVLCLSADGAPVVGAKNLVLGAHTSLEEAPPSTSSSTQEARGPAACSAIPSTWPGCGPSGPRSR